jgi:peptide/nickel transport system substrate-binding protein/oligopeptide transport system substrate-binding protein
MKLFKSPKNRENKTIPVPAPAPWTMPPEMGSYLARVDELAGLLPDMASAIGQLSGTQRQHLVSIQSFGEALARAFEELDSISQASSQVTAKSKEYQQVVSGAEQSLLGTLESFDLVLTEYEHSAGELAGLTATTREMGDLAGMMTSLSLRIKQLVRNAEIKAFHAGTQGRGFGVIAENMSRLASEMERTAARVPVLTEGIRSGVEKIASGMDQSRRTVLELKEQAGQVKTRLIGVNQANQQTVSAFDEISLKARDQREIRDRLVGGIGQISKVADELMVSQEVVTSVLSTEKAELGMAGSARSLLEEALEIQRKNRHNWAAAQAGRGMDLLRFRLAGAAERWRDLQHILEELRDSIKSEEVQSSALWHELEHLFQNTDSIQRRLEAVESGISRSREDFELMSGSLEELFRGLGSIMGWLDGFQSDRGRIQDDLKGVMEAGSGIKDFTEQIKLLSFYAAVEVAEMGEAGADFGGIVSQAQALAKKAAEDSGKLWPLLDKLGRQFETTAAIFQRARQAASHSQLLVDRARASLQGSKDSASAFAGSGQQALGEIRRQIEKHQEIFRLYRSYADSFKDVEQRFSGFSVLLGRFQDTLNHLSQTGDLKGPELAKLQVQFPPEGRIKSELSSDPITLDPAMMTDSTSNQVAIQIHQGLVQFDHGSNVVPALAWRWRISPSGLVWTFYLRKGATFSHGREVQAGDVKYTLERMLDPKVKCPNSYFVEMIKGAREFMAGKTRHVEGIRVVDPYTVRIELQYPFMPFLSNLACTMVSIVPREMVEDRDRQFSKEPCGAGPFMIKNWLPGQSLELERNPGYYQPGLSLAGISYRINLKDEEKSSALTEGQLDLASVNSAQLQELKEKQGLGLLSLPQLNIQYLCVNVSRATPFASARVRQALNHAIDRQALIESTDLAGSAIVAKGVFPPELPAYNPDLHGYKHDPAKAREMLAEAGFPQGLPGEFLLDYREGRAQAQRAELVRKCCQEVGISIKPNPMSWKDLLDKTYGGESVLSFNGWSSDNGDPDNFLYPLFHSKNWGRAGNTSFFKSPIIDELLDEAVAIRNPDERLRRYRRIEQLIVEQAPWVFLFHNLKHMAVSDRVHGYRLRPFGTESLKDCWLEQ